MSIAIVGTGPTAIYTLQHLLASPIPLDITLFEADDVAGFGTPYNPKTNSIEMLANIASIELPSVGLTLLDYLSSCSDQQLFDIGVSRDALGERAFYPRVAIGAYYRDRLAWMAARAVASGHEVKVLTEHRVVDIGVIGSRTMVTIASAGHGSRRELFDQVVLATGHSAPIDRPDDDAPRDADSRSGPKIGILGSSLSAIDFAVSTACRHGSFEDAGYRPDAGSALQITMLSRGGRLPEADFYCPLPAQPLPGFGHDDVAEAVRAAPLGETLDRVFTVFATVLAKADPEYADRIGLDRLSADSFAEAYFLERDSHEPFEWARKNLIETRHNHDNRIVVGWRYAILRCHEAFATCVDALDPDELRRFAAGLKKVFADNYAAVPQQSIERLLALHEAGVLDIQRLPASYSHTVIEATGEVVIDAGPTSMTFDRLLDGRGQHAAHEDEFPFPTLRFTMQANRDLDDDFDGSAVRIDDGYRLFTGLNPIGAVWCLSLPFLLKQKPFVQGLTSSADMGKIAAAAILSEINGTGSQAQISIQDLVDTVHATQPIMVGDNVMLAPRQDG